MKLILRHVSKRGHRLYLEQRIMIVCKIGIGHMVNIARITIRFPYDFIQITMRHRTHASRSVLNVLCAKWCMSPGDFYLYYYTGALWFNSKNYSSFHMMQGDTRRQKCLKVYWSFGAAKSFMCPKWCVVQLGVIADRVPTKISEKSSMIFPGLLQAKIQISRQKKYQYLLLQPMYQFVELITDTHRLTLTHRHMIWSRPTDYSTDLIVIELIQEVKTTLVNLIKMGNRFLY